MTASTADVELSKVESTTAGETLPGEGMSFGHYLTRAREARGLSQDDLAHQTKIRRAIIDALESNARRDLPEKVFVLGYVRSYAIAVGLNVEDTLHRFNVTWVDESQELATDDVKKTGRSFAWLAPLFAASLAVLVFWYIVRMH